MLLVLGRTINLNHLVLAWLNLQDYFVCDNDIVWDGEYEEFIRINKSGQRVLDHSKIDLLKTFKVRYSSVYSIEWFIWMLISGSRAE